MARIPAAPVKVEVKSLSVWWERERALFHCMTNRRCITCCFLMFLCGCSKWFDIFIRCGEMTAVTASFITTIKRSSDQGNNHLTNQTLDLIWALTSWLVKIKQRMNSDSFMGNSPETSMAKVSLLTPARLKATHSTVILRLEGPTVRTLSTSTAPYSSLWTSTVGAWREVANCRPEVFSLHLF